MNRANSGLLISIELNTNKNVRCLGFHDGGRTNKNVRCLGFHDRGKDKQECLMYSVS